MKKYLILFLFLIASIALYWIMKWAYSLWILAAFTGSVWFTVHAALNIITDSIEHGGVHAWVKRLTAIITGFIGFLALIFAVIYFLQDIMLFHPNNSPFCNAYITSHPEFARITVNGDGNKSYKGVIRIINDEKPSPLIIFFIGNATNAAEMIYSMDQAGMWGFFLNYNLLIMDYPGYGLNDGAPNMDDICKESLLAYNYAAGLPYVDDNGIIAGGVSLGTGPAVYLAANRDVKGLFLLAPFANGYDLCNNVLPVFHGPLRLLVRNRLMSEQYAPLVSAPVLIVASRNDETVPFSSSERLKAYFIAEPEFVALSGLGHNSILSDGTTLDSIKEFLQSL